MSLKCNTQEEKGQTYPNPPKAYSLKRTTNQDMGNITQCSKSCDRGCIIEVTRTHRKHHYFKLEVRGHFLEGMTFIPRPGRGTEVVQWSPVIRLGERQPWHSREKVKDRLYFRQRKVLKVTGAKENYKQKGQNIQLSQCRVSMRRSYATQPSYFLFSFQVYCKYKKKKKKLSFPESWKNFKKNNQ